jgi:hypothetical protein
VNRKILLRTGVRTNENEVNPNYPLLAWDGKGTRLTCIYWEEGKIKMFVYDNVKRVKRYKQTISHFEQIQDMKFMPNPFLLLLSAVKNGQSDIFIYDYEKNTFEQVTNDSYADLDATFVSFPNKSGIIFSSTGLIRILKVVTPECQQTGSIFFLPIISTNQSSGRSRSLPT